MSESDSFINEVSEELRRDRMFRLFRRWGPLVVLALVAAVGASAWYEWQKSADRVRAETRAELISDALSAPSGAARLEILPADSDAVAIRLLRAEALVETGDAEAAIAVYDALASDGAAAPAYRDIAVLKRLSLTRDDMTPQDRIAALDPLANGDAPYRLVALEQRAVARIEAGDIDGARDDMAAILSAQDTPQALRSRVMALAEATGGAIDVPAPGPVPGAALAD